MQRRIDEVLRWSEILTDGEPEIRTQINSGLQRKAEVRKGLRDRPDPEAVNPAAFVPDWVIDIHQLLCRLGFRNENKSEQKSEIVIYV